MRIDGARASVRGGQRQRKQPPVWILGEDRESGHEGEDEGFREGGSGALRRRQEGGRLRGRPVIRSFVRKEDTVFEEGLTGWIALFSPASFGRLQMSLEDSSGIGRGG